MSTPTQAPPELPVYAAAPPARPWFKKKRFILPAVAVVFFAMGASGGGSASTATPTPAVTVTVAGPAPAAEVVTKTVAEAPAECGKALDLAGKFVAAVSSEHTAMGAAFGQASKDGDIDAMATGVTDAIKIVTDATDEISGPMGAATAVCRAAIK
jgi:hypothetical protein